MPHALLLEDLKGTRSTSLMTDDKFLKAFAFKFHDHQCSRQDADLVCPHTRCLASSVAETARLILWHMQEHMASCVTQRCMQGPEEDGCAKALTEEAATARQLESAIASDEVGAYCVRLPQ